VSPFLSSVFCAAVKSENFVVVVFELDFDDDDFLEVVFVEGVDVFFVLFL